MGPKLDFEGIKARVAADRARRGLPRTDLVSSLSPGAVFIVRDEKIDFPESALPGATRTTHLGRRVIVVQDARFCRTELPKTLQIIPVTFSFEGEVPSYFHELPDDEPGFDQGRKVALTQLVQPILKSDLEKYTGTLRPMTYAALMRSLADVYGLRSTADAIAGNAPAAVPKSG